MNLNSTIRIIVAYNLDRLNLTRLDAFFSDLTILTRCLFPCVVLGVFNTTSGDKNETIFPKINSAQLAKLMLFLVLTDHSTYYYSNSLEQCYGSAV